MYIHAYDNGVVRSVILGALGGDGRAGTNSLDESPNNTLDLHEVSLLHHLDDIDILMKLCGRVEGGVKQNE
jgi:hypothetical protein